ncbi:carboxypeptidase-like regulatory domain-containing protein [Geothrix sp. PMB-07]|uniref:carboxypeptidase-like regulatory domain-containing protein n=1 Tax=Geothrix sp. PMB-07 TaxID=3068640 RepID=UPI00274099BB|nr:carboxypeptidase-like regulatory domain-containing protein [Geothrix sp. PMB-07]WLT32361.1 carboxypeptidase-like regulatory domain-containing protein [Geothrix sp. PMB-07]
MNTRQALMLPAVAAMLASGTSLVAQVTTGSLSGKVTQGGKPVARARLAFESPALFQPRIVQTDAKGEYRAMLLPVGNYTIKVSAEGMLGKTASNVRVGLGSNLTMDFPLAPPGRSVGQHRGSGRQCQ